ncbi:uncharacterized protein BO80DRAFT_428160 [Aspergillus ibericus CBS 121593]|uniref:Uncharacterized protein n=1 Tax=Aspergillus ibericus CBS 121593 TaxID=1448316 RepID=A0A395GPQ2_9EURO|nr:hypothetical protein BO80DRAFT_428160 [Aspergillus ibericus CBS 121593]RAK97490.1 hypothetical protein BO80DRAFT_428160 [Aspergillus ibericus CBS 121593]
MPENPEAQRSPGETQAYAADPWEQRQRGLAGLHPPLLLLFLCSIFASAAAPPPPWPPPAVDNGQSGDGTAATFPESPRLLSLVTGPAPRVPLGEMRGNMRPPSSQWKRRGQSTP